MSNDTRALVKDRCLLIFTENATFKSNFTSNIGYTFVSLVSHQVQVNSLNTSMYWRNPSLTVYQVNQFSNWTNVGNASVLTDNSHFNLSDKIIWARVHFFDDTNRPCCARSTVILDQDEVVDLESYSWWLPFLTGLQTVDVLELPSLPEIIRQTLDKFPLTSYSIPGSKSSDIPGRDEARILLGEDHGWGENGRFFGITGYR